MSHGGRRPGSGRKSKAEELKLIEKLSPMEDTALKVLAKGIKDGEFPYLKLYFEYFYGKPTESVDVEHSGELDNNVKLDVSKLSDDAIRQLLNARGDKGSNG